MESIPLPLAELVSVPLWVFAGSSLLALVFAITAVGHLVGSCYQKPRNNCGGVWGFVLSLLIVLLVYTVLYAPAAVMCGAALVTSAWFIYGLLILGAIR